MDQRGHGRDQVDPAVMPHLRCQRGAPSVHAPRVQFGEFDADAADAEDGAAVVADQPAGEADQDRSEGRQPRTIRYIPNGRGRGCRDRCSRTLADRPAADTARASMTGEIEPDATADDGRRAP
jgi:hypothetical protein